MAAVGNMCESYYRRRIQTISPIMLIKDDTDHVCMLAEPSSV
jgi:hypothetical protein